MNVPTIRGAREAANKKRGTQIADRRLAMADTRRVGPARRAADYDITPERLKEDFGFRGINFGNWTNQAERQASVNATYDALLDLAEMLGVPPKALSLNGMLGLAFGAQGSGANGAHFVPGVNEINLTKTHGAGALAHEWAHALDHYFANHAGLARREDPYLSGYASGPANQPKLDESGRKIGTESAFGEGLRPEIGEAFRKIYATMTKRQASPEEVDQMREERLAKTMRSLDSFIAHIRKGIEQTAKAEEKEAALAEYDALADRLRAGDMGEGYSAAGRLNLPQAVAQMRVLLQDKAPRSSYDLPENWKGLSSWASTVAYQKEAKESDDAHIPQISTDYAKGARSLDSDKGGKTYWTKPTEMFARAFETYVVDRLEADARRNDYLSYPMQDENKHRYPEGEERQAIDRAFGELVGELKTRETERGVELYELEKEEPSDFEKFHQVMAAEPVDIKTGEITREDSERAYRELKPVVNESDGRKIEFVNAAFGKIARHKERGLIQRVVPQLDEIARVSIPIYSEPERFPERRTNVEQYHNYLIRARIDDGTYFVRLTARELRDEQNHLYNVSISDLEIAKTGAGDDISRISNLASNFPLAGSDKMLTQWIEKVKAQAQEHELSAEGGRLKAEGAGSPSRVALKDVMLDALREHYKGQSVERDEQYGGVWIKTTGGRSWYVHAVDHIAVDEALVEFYFGRKPAAGDTYTAKGAYLKGRGIVRLVKDKGTNRWTIAHENIHVLEDYGMFTNEEIRAIRNKIIYEAGRGNFKPTNPNDIGGKEDRANWLRQEQFNREAHRGILQRILMKVADFIDSVASLFTVTSRSVVRKLASGEIYRRTGTEPLMGIEKGEEGGRRKAEGGKSEYDIVEDNLPPAVAAEYKESGGIQRGKILDKIKDKAKTAVATFTPGRMFPQMNNKNFARENVLLREFMEAGASSRAIAVMDLKDILDPKNLKNDEYQLFGLKLVLDDLQRDLEPGGALEDWQDIVAANGRLAFGFKSKTEVDDSLAKINAEIAKRPRVAASLSRRKKILGDLRRDLVQKGMLPDQVLGDDRYFHHQVLEYANAKRGISSDGDAVRVRKAGWQYARQGSIKSYNTNYLESELEILAQGYERLAKAKVLDAIEKHSDIMKSLRAEAKSANKAAFKTLLAADPQLKGQYDSLPSNEKAAFKKKTLGRNYRTWRDAMKNRAPRSGSRAWAEWVPEPRTAWYMTNSINDQVLGEVLAGNHQLEPGDVRRALVRGADRHWVIPIELAEVMNGADFQRIAKDNVVAALAENTLNMWKRWILLNPLRVIKYNLNNLSGDLDIVLAYDPRILRYVSAAMRDLWRYHYGKEMSPGLKDEIKEFLREGVIGGLTAHDIPDVGNMPEFRRLERALGARDNVAIGLIDRYWQGTKNFTQWRENILRVAAYRFFKEQVAAGERVYGASDPAKVDAIANSETSRKSGLLARELIGDYGGISKGGQWLRRKMIPFYAWNEVNAPRYYRMMKNIAVEGKPTGKRIALLGAVAGKKSAFFGMKAFMLYGAIALWNAMVFPEEEEELGEEGRRQMHLILGRRSDGSIMTMRLQGALSDALSWFNLHDFPEDMKELANGKKTVYQWAGEAAREPVNKMIQGMRPDIKGFGELIGGKTVYPDFTRPRPIRDKGEYVARMLSLEGFYRRAMGRPMRGGDVAGQVWDDVLRTFSYSASPGETAYYGAREMVGKFLEERGIERPFHEPTDRSNALYWYKTAIKYGDAEAAERYLKKYKELGGTMKGLKISVDRAHPLASLPKKYRTKFLNELSDEDRETVKRAGKWYKETFKR